ncbi:MarR family winged helix-turn-helix transcriptional regulator [Aciditerrimonas ferrireducens]|uniref:MarR family winged helix-turn-helix transcriptional regulator n=1 Tax=Aciditerrimonas ferrireducens TaxID=667306 RepID=UPI002003C1D1|nr:MarR family transcriptional regulator [Aciditerrimonas ferrireducens]MCK4175968.1 MarR family transcriptional regulator [Aciditerrimonas ferrireducens]
MTKREGVATREQGVDRAATSGVPAGGTAEAARRDQLVAELTELHPALRRLFEVKLDRAQRALWGPLTVHQLEALLVLTRGSVTMGELCEELDISESAGTALCDRLVGRGLVERCSDPQDRRVVRLQMSGQAKGMVEAFAEVKRRQMARALSVLETADLEELVGILRRLVARSELADHQRGRGGAGRANERPGVDGKEEP